MSQEIPERRRRSPLPREQQGVRSLVRCRCAARFVCVRTETMNAWAWGWAELTGWLDGPCRDDANGFTATAALGSSLPLICGEVRIHTWFSAGCCWPCVTPGSHLPFF